MPNDIVTASGSKIYIGPSVSSATDTLMEFQQITAWTEISLVENMGELGDESAAVSGAAIGDSRIRKAKGARDAGTLALVCFHDPDDAGQLAVEDAEATNLNYAFKIVLADAPSGETNSILYFRGLVMSQRLNVGTNDNIMRRNFNIAVNSPVIVNPATV
jgi:tail tube protein